MPGTEPERALVRCRDWLRAQPGELAASGVALCSAALRGDPLDAACPQPPAELPADLAGLDDAVVLDGLLVAAVRADDLATGAVLLRTALLAGEAHRPTVTRAVDLLLVSARDDGGFGVTWRGEAGAERVPVTVDCAWALAEYHRQSVGGKE
ncbi:MAG TPA: hypothetical protein VHH34_19335 [Pseudonocardiaceae bacterium]|nr:hypothetical protein [Pseudonocardiaceae bacterium]